MNQKTSVLKGSSTPAQAQRAVGALNALRAELKTWDKVSANLADKYAPSFLWQIGNGKRPPPRRLLLTLGIVKATKRSGIRLRISRSDAREILEFKTFPDSLRERLVEAVEAYDRTQSASGL